MFKEFERIHKEVEKEIKKVGTKVISPLVPPETRTEKKLLKEETYFICSICRRELGPVDNKKWIKLLEFIFHGLNITRGVINPVDPLSVVCIATGTLGIGKTLFGDSSLNLLEIPKKELEKREIGKKYLIQCPLCARWVCIDCWNTKTGVCKACSAE